MYDTVFWMFLAAGFIGVAALAVGGILGPKKGTGAKIEAYESGVPAVGTARERFPVHFYLVAMMFIMFDIETAFFYPLAVRFKAQPEFLFFNALIFVVVLMVGYFYILKKGVLNWR